MRKIICDGCGKVLPPYAEPYGSWFKNVTWTIKVSNNTSQNYPPYEWHLCENCFPTFRHYFDSLSEATKEEG